MKTFPIQFKPLSKFKRGIYFASLFFFMTLMLKSQYHEERPIQAFNKIETIGSVTVFYTESDTLSLNVYANKDEIEGVKTEIENFKLIISNKGKFTEVVKVYVKANSLNALECGGASSFKTLNKIKSDSLSIGVSGSASAKLKVDARTINSTQSGASQLTLNGSSTHLRSELSGASGLSAYGLISENVSITTTGASSAKVYASKKVMANAGGASSIKIKGDVKDISAEASPSSSITRIVDKQDKTETAEGDSVIYKWKGKKIIIIDKEDEEEKKTTYTGKEDYFDGFKHWTGFSMGVNGFLDAKNNIEIEKPYDYMNLDYSNSFNYQFNLFENRFKLVRNKLVVVTGFGFDYHSYELENKTRLNADSSFTWGLMDASDEYSYKKNRYRNTYIQIPLLLEFNAKNKSYKCFHMAVGVIGQYQILSRTRQVLSKDSYDIENVRKDAYNTNPFSAKAHVNLGYARWTFFGEYNLTPLFQKNKGPELYPFSVGLRIIPFG